MLFDHNTPESTLKKVFGQVPVKVTDIIDHHAVVDVAFVATVASKVVESSCSCCSVLIRHASRSTIEQVQQLYPALIQAACIVIAYDAFNFPPAEKGVRYW